MDSEGSTRGRRVCTLSYGVSFCLYALVWGFILCGAPRARTHGRTDGTREFDEGRVGATRASERRDRARRRAILVDGRRERRERDA